MKLTSSWWNNTIPIFFARAIVIVNRKLINQLYLLTMGLLGLFFFCWVLLQPSGIGQL
jgi:hypothetical protein